MQLHEITFSQAMPIEGYGPGFFRLGGQVMEGPICVTADGATRWDGFGDAETLIEACRDVDVCFIGTGAETAHVPTALREALEAFGIGIEAMNSPAACRTYNVLLAEGRRIALALLPV